MTDVRHGADYRGRGGGHDIGPLDACVRHCRSDRDSAVVIHPDRLQALHPADVDEMPETGQPEGEHRKKALPTGKHLAVPAIRFEQCDRLVDRVRSVIVEWRHLHWRSPFGGPGLYALYDGRSFVPQTARGHLEGDQDLVAFELAHGGQYGGNPLDEPPLSERNCAVSHGTGRAHFGHTHCPQRSIVVNQKKCHFAAQCRFGSETSTPKWVRFPAAPQKGRRGAALFRVNISSTFVG